MFKNAIKTAGCVAILTACSGEPAAGDAPPAANAAAEGGRVAMKQIRVGDPDHGRTLFVDKGCVICHAVNGAGGKAAPPLDAPIGAEAFDPLEFAARMWRGAPAMIELQSVELGYTIHLTADEIRDLAAFSSDRAAQRALTADDLPPEIAAGLLDQRFWEMEDWDQFLRGGREGYEVGPAGAETPQIEEMPPVDPD